MSEIFSAGPIASTWIENFLSSPRGDGRMQLLAFQKRIINSIMVCDSSGKFSHHTSLISRPKGFGKTPLSASIILATLFAPIHKGSTITENGEVPRAVVISPRFEQIKLIFQIISKICDNEIFREIYGSVHVTGSDGGTIQIRKSGKISAEITSIRMGRAPTPVEGVRNHVFVFDQAESIFDKSIFLSASRDAAKTGGFCLALTNAVDLSGGSLSSFLYKKVYVEKNEDIFFTEQKYLGNVDILDTEEKIEKSLRDVYKEIIDDELGWISDDEIRSFVSQWKILPKNEFFQFFLNVPTLHSENCFLTFDELEENIVPVENVIDFNKPFFLAFDGCKGTSGFDPPDEACLLAGQFSQDVNSYRGQKLKLQTIFSWHAPKTWQRGESWFPDRDKIVEEIINFCNKHEKKIISFYADPSFWLSEISKMEREISVTVPASKNSKIAFSPSGKNIKILESATEMLYFFIASGSAEISKNDTRLQQHFLNARRRDTRSGFLLSKDKAKSKNKIDLAACAVMIVAAYENSKIFAPKNKAKIKIY